MKRVAPQWARQFSRRVIFCGLSGFAPFARDFWLAKSDSYRCRFENTSWAAIFVSVTSTTSTSEAVQASLIW
jgi:hypothetical protein